MQTSDKNAYEVSAMVETASGTRADLPVKRAIHAHTPEEAREKFRKICEEVGYKIISEIVVK